MKHREGDSQEGSVHTAMYNPHFLSLNMKFPDVSKFAVSIFPN